MPRVLFIGSGTPWLGGAGYLVRQNLFLVALAQICELHLALFDCPADAAAGFAGPVTSLTMPRRTAASKLKFVADDLLSPDPRMFRGFDLTEPHRQVRALNPESFDAVFAYRIDFAYFAGVLNHPRLILDIDDPEHTRGQRRLRAAGLHGDRRTLRDLAKLAVFERRAVAQAKLAFVCQENDRNGWNTLPEVVPNCVQVPADPVRKVGKPMVLFVGNCAGGEASPNVSALRFFLADVWPKISRALPDAEFHVVGGGTEMVQKSNSGVANVHWRGFVDDLSEVYAQSSVSVAPIRFGTGTRIKILEAFAHACPVVSTLAGAEGIDVVPGRNIELAEGAEHFAERTLDLLRDPMLAGRIGQGGYALVRSHYDVQVQQQKLADRLGEFLREKAAK